MRRGREGSTFRAEEILQGLNMLVSQGGAHRDRDEFLAGRGHVEPGEALAGESLELRAKAAAPLVDKVRLVNDEVLEVAQAGGGGETAAEAEFHGLRGGHHDALRPVADSVADLLLVVVAHPARVGVLAAGARALAQRGQQLLHAPLEVEG